jgi:hypothetical protein
LRPLNVCIVLTALAGTSLAAPQRAGRAPALPRFERLSDTGAHGVVTLAFDSGAYAGLAEQHARGLPFVLDDFPLPGHTSVSFELRPVGVMQPGATAVVLREGGSVARIAPRARCFSGYVLGGGAVFLGVTGKELHGYFYAEDELYFVSSGEGFAGRATLAHSSQLGDLDAGACGAIDRILPVDRGGIERALAGPTLKSADVFVEADNVYRSRFASDQACIDYTTLLFTAVSEIYHRDIGAVLRIPDGYLRVWNTTPPWGVITGFASLKNVYTWWLSTANPLKNIPRAAVHVLTTPVFGGTSRGVDGLCVFNRAFEISSVSGSFPYPRQHTNRYNWDLFVVSHELGHTFGSPHSALYSPPIECEDGSGPDKGTIMSYCHTTYGVAQVGMRFHYREQLRIRNAIASDACLRTQLLTPGDYDGDTDVDENDLSALRAVLGQGFRSIAAEEVFDLDANGVLNDADHDAVAQIVYNAPPAQWALRNGSGINPSCLESLSSPLLGTTWRARILAAGVGSATLLVGYDQPLDGQLTTRGELLVKTLTLGGTKIFSSSSVSDGVSAMHEIALPLDPLLYGRQVAFQGLVIDGPDGNQYCNALDVTLSPYE